jgi:hypothetical protein
MKHAVDIAILYSENDNLHDDNHAGWVTQFGQFLALLLIQMNGSQPQTKLISNKDSLETEVVESASAIIIIVSQAFINDKQNRAQLESIHYILQDPSKRIIKILKNPIRFDNEPLPIRPFTAYEMFLHDDESGDLKNQHNYFDDEYGQHYWMTLIDLAHQLSEALSPQKKMQDESALERNKTIYLSEVAGDVSIQRNIIKREIQRFGYTVLPSGSLPLQIESLEEHIRRDLRKCSKAILLIGNMEGAIPFGSEKSILEIQSDLITEHRESLVRNDQPFEEFIWVTPNTKQANERQRNFITKLKREIEVQVGIEVLQVPLEDFKNTLREELNEANIPKEHSNASHHKSVYLIHDKVDIEAIPPMVHALEEAGYHVIKPSFEGELLRVRENHIENLRDLDIAIIYKGSVNEQWVKMKALDLLKAPGFGRKKPILAKVLISPPGALENKDSYALQDLKVLEAEHFEALKSLKRFIHELNL